MTNPNTSSTWECSSKIAVTRFTIASSDDIPDNADKSCKILGKEHHITVRREAQVGDRWIQISAGSTVFVPTDARPMMIPSKLRQVSRWPEDWTANPADYTASYTQPVWVVCWVPRIAAWAMVRQVDLSTGKYVASENAA